ncbi:MAG: hypothetical protein IJL98_06260 [Lachnospiraceae bacterium]|nr:hypothetical protein [Lachnospiraceae bacterium]
MRAFETFTYRDWCCYYESLNQGLSAEECTVKLNDEEKEAYRKEAEKLAEDRKKHPDLPFFTKCRNQAGLTDRRDKG